MLDKLKRLCKNLSKLNHISYFYSDGNQGDLLMNNKNRQEIQNRFSLRKLTIGLASVSLGMFFMQTSNQVKADATVQTGQQTLGTNQADKKPTAQGQSPATDTTTPIAPSTTVPSYDGTKVVDTPFYNNPQGTNSKLIDNQSKTGQYTFYFTAKDASGKEYASSYAAEKNNPKGVVLNSILDKDDGAYDPSK